MRSKQAPATSAAAAAPKAKATPKPAETSGGDLDPRAVALPGKVQFHEYHYHVCCSTYK